MLPMIVPITLAALLVLDDTGRNDARLLIETIESLQHPVEDFRCEFEGTIRLKGKIAEYTPIGEGGLHESFGGVFIWKRGGDTHSESLHRMSPSGRIERRSLVVRMRQNQAEQYNRLNDAPLGRAIIQSPKGANSWTPSCLGFIFLIDTIKRDVAHEYMEPSVYDDPIDGRTLKVLNLGIKGVPDSLVSRYWIDLQRNGHVVRVESYSAPGKVMNSRLDIKLAPFKIDGTEVWMPVSGEQVGYAALDGKKPVITKEPTSITKIYVVGCTIDFNSRPGREVFTINSKPGTPISDNLRKLQFEFGQQKIGLKPTKSDAEQMLREQLAQAEEQKTTLIVASSSEGFDWTSWMAWGFGALVLISSLMLWFQRRGR